MTYKNKQYQGWKNYYTWNVALHIDNEYSDYLCAKEFMRSYKGRSPYIDFVRSYNLLKTFDGVSFTDSRLSRKELNIFMWDLLQ